MWPVTSNGDTVLQGYVISVLCFVCVEGERKDSLKYEVVQRKTCKFRISTVMCII